VLDANTEYLVRFSTMIEDAVALREIQIQWTGVLALREKIQRHLFSSSGIGGGYPAFAADCAHNLPFLHACSVFNEALLQARNEGLFVCQSFFLGGLVKAAEHHLKWVNYEAVVEMVDKRNQLAHHGALLPRRDCWRYLSAIESELRGWSILP
jgi:hypothetical protein